MSSADIPKLYKDYQVRSAVISEKERAIASKRAALVELRNQVHTLTDHCNRRQSMLNQEATKFAQKKQIQDEKWNERHRVESVTIGKLQSVLSDEHTMVAGIAQMEQDLMNAAQSVVDARADAKMLEEAKASMSALSFTLETEDASTLEFEKSVAKQEATLAARVQRLTQQMPNNDYRLPTAVQSSISTSSHHLPTNNSGGASDIGGESIMLVDEFSY